MVKGRSLDKAVPNGGYIWIENSFVDNILPFISPRALQVYVFLVRKAPQQKEYNPLTKSISMKQIGRFLNCSRETVSKAIQELETHKVIEKVKVKGMTNRYLLLDTCPENLAGIVKKTGQCSQENLTPPAQKTSQVNAGDYHETRASGSPKNTVRESKSFKRNRKRGLKPIQSPSRSGSRRV